MKALHCRAKYVSNFKQDPILLGARDHISLSNLLKPWTWYVHWKTDNFFWNKQHTG